MGSPHSEALSIIKGYANVAELVDALDLGSSAVRRGGSSPFIRTRLFSILRIAPMANAHPAPVTGHVVMYENFE